MNTPTRLACAVFAIAGASSVAAQSSVQIYGRINTSVEHQKHGDISATGLASNSSFLGFQIKEGLGQGLKLGVVLEAGLEVDTGSGVDGKGLDFMRHSELNLSGRAGMLRMGAFDSVSYTTLIKPVSLHNDDAGSSANLFDFTYKKQNILAYRTPSWSGWTAEVQRNFGEKQVYEDTLIDDGGWDLGVNYAQGPWGLGFAYGLSKESLVPVEAKFRDKYWGARVSYVASNWELAAHYVRFSRIRDISDEDGLLHGHNETDQLRLAGVYRWGASELHANVAKHRMRLEHYALPGMLEMREPGPTTTQWTVAYHYNLSARSKVYALFSKSNNSAPGGTIAKAEEWEPKFQTFGIGVRHIF